MLFILPAFAALAERERPRGGISQGFVLLLVFVFFVIAFRETGGDYSTYERMFHLMEPLSFDEAIQVTDPGYGGSIGCRASWAGAFTGSTRLAPLFS